ncbi:hypothetical protein CR513_18671, partial [Mucuna pruriens]
MIDAASGGALMDKMPAVTRHLISNMASNTQQFGIRGVGQPRMVNEIGVVDNLRLENQLTELTSLVRVCGLYTSVEHPTDMCTTLQETKSDHPKSVGEIGAFSARAESRALCSLAIRICPECTSNSKWLSSVESTTPSITVPITTTTENATSRQLTISGRLDEVVTSKHYKPSIVGRVRQPTLINNSKSEGECECICPIAIFNQTRKLKTDEELLKKFRKVEINIPLLDAIKKIPKYAKFLKELCVHKRKKMKGGVELGGICRDPEIFSIPCTISDYTFFDAVLDLGASINVMPTSIYKSLNFGDLGPTRMTIQLANRSVVQPLGILEDVLA